MNIKVELLKAYIRDYINANIEDFDIDENKIINTVSIKVLSEIQSVIKDESIDDFDAIEEIVEIFEKYWLDAGIRHDSG